MEFIGVILTLTMLTNSQVFARWLISSERRLGQFRQANTSISERNPKTRQVPIVSTASGKISTTRNSVVLANKEAVAILIYIFKRNFSFKLSVRDDRSMTSQCGVKRDVVELHKRRVDESRGRLWCHLDHDHGRMGFEQGRRSRYVLSMRGNRLISERDGKWVFVFEFRRDPKRTAESISSENWNWRVELV